MVIYLWSQEAIRPIQYNGISSVAMTPSPARSKAIPGNGVRAQLPKVGFCQQVDTWDKHWAFWGGWREIKWKRIWFVLFFLLTNESFCSDINCLCLYKTRPEHCARERNFSFPPDIPHRPAGYLGKDTAVSLTIPLWKLHSPVLMDFINTVHAVETWMLE